MELNGAGRVSVATEDIETVEPIAPPSPPGKLTNQQILLGKRRDPIEVIRGYSDDEWEQFIHEWAEGLRGKYGDVRPRAYYFVAPRGVGPDALRLLENRSTICDQGIRGGKLVDGPSASRGCRRADPEVCQAAHYDAGVGAHGGSLPGATASRPAEPVLQFQPGGPPAARGAAGMRPRGRERPGRGGPVSHRRCTGSAAAPPTGPPSAVAVPKGSVPGSKLVDGSVVSCGCWRADPGVRQAARITMPARGRVAKLRATGRRAEPAMPPQPGGPPATSGRRTRDRAGRERTSVRRAARSAKLADGSAVPCGCRRADPDVREAARMTMPARWGRMANRCLAP
jgi:hypothetical protein